MTQYIKKLPAVFQTVTQKKFFDATIDQVFSKKDSELLTGYLGRRTPGYYNPVTDFYIPEPSKDRTWWQLESTSYSLDASSNKTNIFFYEDLLNKVEYYGGNVLNQDRLFQSDYYSFGPPIDYDMFINYHNYYWVEQGLSTISITGVMYSDIAGKTSFNTADVPGALPANLQITSGMTIALLSDPNYSAPHTVENIGGCVGIRLVPQFPDFTDGAVFEFLPWDGKIQLSTGRIIDNTNWDNNTWDTQTQPSTGDYITIERGSLDRNAWSRTNKWYHVDAITSTIMATGTAFPVNATRALRPIIQFIADLNLWKSGTQFRSNINYGLRNDEFGNPLRYSQYQGMQVADLNTSLNIDLTGGELVCFFNDDTSFDFWDTQMWDAPPDTWDAGFSKYNEYIFEVTILPNGSVNFVPYTSWSTIVLEGDIVFVTEDGPWDAAQRGQTWYYEDEVWAEAFNDKTTVNQPPLFMLYDHLGVRLNDPVKYPNSNFNGNKIFSYKENTTPGATVDPVLKFPIVYTALGQSSDIVFQNNLITDRNTYGVEDLPIDGYYYYKTSTDPVFYNNWNLYQPCSCDIIQSESACLQTSKQRVIDRFVVGYGTEYQFMLSVTPFDYPTDPDLIVIVNGDEVKHESEQLNGYTFETINNRLYVNLENYINLLLTTVQSQPPVVELQSYTHELLDPESTGYFEIPQQLEANPGQLEVSEISGSNLIQHFASIISNQFGEEGVAYGGPNNFRDTKKNRSLGKFILQNVAPTLKSMLVSSSDDLDFITGERFSQSEYTKFKNKYLKIALQLINQGFNPVQYHNNNIVISAWVDEILQLVSVTNEYSDAFAYSYMIASGSPITTETFVVPPSGIIDVSAYIDLSKPENALYVYDVTSQETLLLINQDYRITSTNLLIQLEMNSLFVGSTVTVALYKSPLPAYIPSTPTKVGAYPASLPRIEWDTTYITPTNVIVGHDGSRTVAFNDYRDDLLLELEKRIYNLLNSKFINQYYLPLRIESVKPGAFRKTRYSTSEYLDITESYINKWSASNRANYRANDWLNASQNPDVVASFVPGVGNIWKLYNYSKAKNNLNQELNLPGNWKGIFQFYYDTYTPDTQPWNMLGFSQQPDWWVTQYGPGVLNLAGQTVWPNTLAYAPMWDDIENGIIRQGPSAIYDPVTLQPQSQPLWARPGLSSYIPVNAAGEIISVMELFDVIFSGNYYAPFDHFDDDWAYGDGAPVEQAWMNTSAYAFSVQEIMFLTRPGPYGELMWDTVGTEISAGMINVPGISGPVMSSLNWQYVQNDTYQSDDGFFNWTRPKNKNQQVHAESVDGVIQVRYGYQQWISDRILFLGKSVSDTFGQKIRTLDVNLANKLAGFTNKDTTNFYIEAVSPNNMSTNTLIIPSTNFDVLLHKSPVVETYSYSGVIIRALADGNFAIYGYDLLNAEFNILERSTAKLIDITIGGTPAPFLYFTPGATYKEGDIVRYNGVYYVSLVTQQVQTFIPEAYKKLKSLPIIDGISVSYKPVSDTKITKIPYGSIMNSAQEVFDFLIGWGAYLESKGWKFQEVNQDTNIIDDWLSSAKQFLFWLNTEWAPDASIQLSPLANKATLTVSVGYPNDVETLSNGVYSILDKYGVAISPNNTTTEREGQTIIVAPTSLAAGGIYYLQINSAETEHIVVFDNLTSFNDVVYSPLLRARQERLRFNGFRSNNWYGKLEADGYLIIGNELVPNYNTIVDSMRYYYDPNTTIDNPSIEDLGRHLIGYESKSYLDNLQVANNTQYLFYQGAIRQKGTSQSFEKLFRSTKVQSNEIIEVFEEWALRLGKFGNTVEQVSTEFVLTPEQNTGEVIVARLNYVPSTVGSVRQINILNAENKYTVIPKIVIYPPDANPLDPAVTEPLRQARAYAVLDAQGRISRVDITDHGYGYLEAPYVAISSGTEPHNLDKLYSVWQGAAIKDTVLDNVVNIDIDQTDKWTVRPNDPAYSLEFPTTDNIVYPMPNAGYVHFDDVTWSSFDTIQTAVRWGTPQLNPRALDTVWIAKDFVQDWNVYKLTKFTKTWSVAVDENNDILLLLNTDDAIIPQLWATSDGDRTDFGNMVVLQQVVNNIPVADNNYTVGISPYTTTDYSNPGIYTDPDTLETYNAYYLMTLDGVPITTNEIGDFELFTDLLLFKTMRWYDKPVEPNLPTYVGLGDFVWVDNVDSKWAVFKIQAEPGFWDIAEWDAPVIEFWSPNYGWDVTGPLYFTPHRVQEPLINTSLFESASVYDKQTSNELVQLPIYDPFKNILPGPAKQNITYMSLQDPASYNVTANLSMFSENITFAERQVGQLWWDLSSTRYVYYEQPKALNSDETENDNLVYRRNNWARLFPGSTVAIYEWVKSPVPPSLYTGSGIPRDTTSYVQVTNSNRFTNLTETTYYFWVQGSTDLPNVINRTLAAVDVAALIQSPKSQGFVFFCPIQQTSTNNCYMFYNVQEILAYKGDNVQIEYRLAEREDQEHAQWAFFREGDSSSTVTDQFWNKMVDSLCGYTKVLPVSNNINGIIIAKDLPWDIYGWDIAAYDSASSTTTPQYGEILPVPDPMLSEGEKYGIEYRPRQGMFVSLQAARRVFVQAANELLKHYAIRDDNPSWDENVATDIYWTYTNWYKVGYENVKPTIVYQTLLQASNALSAGILTKGDIVEVTNGTVDGRFTLYAVVQLNPAVPALSLDEVGVENSAIKLLDTIYTSKNVYSLAVELRELLNAFRTQVMINNSLVDQNELFFSMLNFVISEQKNPDWVFKSSYIYIKENNLQLSQTRLYDPDQIGNIVKYITDVKPYHTQVRDYATTHVTSDIAVGTASDTYKWNIKLDFGPDGTGYWDMFAWDTNNWDNGPTVFPYILNAQSFTDNLEQFVSQESVYTLPLTFYDEAKKGYSQLYPYTFSADSIFLNAPQTFITPHNIVGVQIDDIVLIYGQDYIVEFNNDNTTVSDGTYTVYFYNDPTWGASAPVALIWFDGGNILTTPDNKFRQELAFGFATDDMVINVETKLPVNDLTMIPNVAEDAPQLAGFTVAPYVGWGEYWDAVDDPVLSQILTDEGGTNQVPWDVEINLRLMPNTIGYKENINKDDGANFYRHCAHDAGTLLVDLPVPTADNQYTQSMIVYVDPNKHVTGTDIFPDPSGEFVAVWINGERIEYGIKTPVADTTDTWELGMLRRGTQGTSVVNHAAYITDINTTVTADMLYPGVSYYIVSVGTSNFTLVGATINQPGIAFVATDSTIGSGILIAITPTVANTVWIENMNVMNKSSNNTVWNSDNSLPDDIGNESHVMSVPLGGLWYAQTNEATFLKHCESNILVQEAPPES